MGVGLPEMSDLYTAVNPVICSKRMTHRITLADSNRHFDVEDDQTILAAGLRAGLALPYGCQSGACAACRVRVLDGELLYPDNEIPPALTPGEAARGFAVICNARARTDLTIQLEELPGQKAIRVRNLPCRVAARKQLAHDVVALKLRLPGNERLDYLAGQYIDFLLSDGRRRSFSLATAPGGDYLELHVRLIDNGQFSQFINTELQDDHLLRFEGPLGGFYLRESNKPALLIAGGTGIAPIHAMLQQAVEVQRQSRPLHLYWGVRSQRDLYLHDALRKLAAYWPTLTYTPVLSEPDHDTEDEQWRGRTGWVHQAAAQDHPDLSDFEVYMSGPPPMIDAARNDYVSQGLNLEDLHFDAFDYAHETWADGEPGKSD